MKMEKCALCGSKAELCMRENPFGEEILYGAYCKNSVHFIEPMFKTQDDAIAAWNETQKFIRRYGGELPCG